jgi:hypothetical protein
LFEEVRVAVSGVLRRVRAFVWRDEEENALQEI